MSCDRGQVNTNQKSWNSFWNCKLMYICMLFTRKMCLSSFISQFRFFYEVVNPIYCHRTESQYHIIMLRCRLHMEYIGFQMLMRYMFSKMAVCQNMALIIHSSHTMETSQNSSKNIILMVRPAIDYEFFSMYLLIWIQILGLDQTGNKDLYDPFNKDVQHHFWLL